MHTAKHVHSTQSGDELIDHIARVSALDHEMKDSLNVSSRLIAYLIRKGHWSPFAMANICVEVMTTRDIGRQMLRHKSLEPQEFSGRYAEYPDILDYRECRFQHPTNRQSSVEVTDAPAALGITLEEARAREAEWDAMVLEVAEFVRPRYRRALELQVAKEQARAILPEGLTPTRMYFNGGIRGWIHYLRERLYPGTQKEHRLVAMQVSQVFTEKFPKVYAALEILDYLNSKEK